LNGLAVYGRWPQSRDQLDPFGIRDFSVFTVSGFHDASDGELCLTFFHPGGKAVVRITASR
jgi:hypothetical protein